RARGLSMLRHVPARAPRLPGARAQLGGVAHALLYGTDAVQQQVALDWQRVERRLLGLRARHEQARSTLPGRDALRHKYRIQAHYLRRRAGLGKPALLAAAAVIARS